MIRAGQGCAVGSFFGISHNNLYQPFSMGNSQLTGLSQSALYTLPHLYSVNYYFDCMLEVFFQGYVIRFKMFHFAVNSHPGKALPVDSVKNLLVLPLSLSHNGSQHNKLCALFLRHQQINNLIYSLTAYFSAAYGTVRNAYPGVHQSQIIVYFRYRSHC